MPASLSGGYLIYTGHTLSVTTICRLKTIADPSHTTGYILQIPGYKGVYRFLFVDFLPRGLQSRR
ncbi:hypothetical protein A8C56_19380 [Niabella ginsenosidivorans]|uniref:Uncharacterized protein n=1 Tax=Niabella ginsenosidivorans TaxID=1176587 RepID=A0A1A9I730_9BACT|nr:hypothetical protein A8C56_19380 [Niabella ginsenosidivorans]